MNPRAKKVLKTARALAFKLANPHAPKFQCPLCRYEGPFMGANDPTGYRAHAMCPNCSALERHRLQWLVIEKLARENDFSRLSVLHFAPEPAMAELLRPMFHRYESADLSAPGVDHHVDLRALPFADRSYDVVVASHVLEHIKEDTTALSEIKRILRPGGFAILPVPLIGDRTIEYPEPNPREWYHVRAPGYDYFDRYEPIFASVKRYPSSAFDGQYQPFVHEDRSGWPTANYPHRVPSQGERHEDVVPVCYV